MRELLEETLLLQTDYTHDPKDPDMLRRSKLVEQEIPAWIRAQLEGASLPSVEDFLVQGKGRAGNNSEIPWSRVYDKTKSRSATIGWYLVYLFSANGDTVYLSLIQGTSEWDLDKGDFVPRPPEQLALRVKWAQGVLGDAGHNLSRPVALQAKQRLGKGYEKGSVDAIAYPIDAIPSEDVLRTDLLEMCGLLATIYAAEEASIYVPGDPPPEVEDAVVTARQSAGKARTDSGQGINLTVAEKLAIERHAVDAATEYFKAEGYTVKDVGAKKSFDLEAKRGLETVSVEVKGTTSAGAEVILTIAEVEHHQSVYPANALAVVHSIDLDRSQDAPKASGGTLVVTQPWSIEESSLRAISYRYKTP
ncbi:DUF3578 domain-containing protein [Rhodococcus hoagii]|nr:DUF3578 domain-containing protein [Prescottella equi]